MMEKLKKYKWTIIFLSIIYFILVYCHFQTFIINDDILYSLFFRGNERITNIFQIISNQYFDYFHISPRIFLHIIVQFLLIFDKNLWSVVNPMVIIAIIVLMVYFIKQITKTKAQTFYIIIASTIVFLLLYDYKYLVYWVAGSVNYVWVFLALLGLSVYYFKYGFLKKPVLSAFICLTISILCEVSAIFTFVLLLCDLAMRIFINKEDKKVILKYLWFIVPSLLGLCFILLAPSTLGRMALSNGENSGIVNMLLTSIPYLSNKLFSVTNIYNIFPILTILSIIYYLKRNNIKTFKFIFIALVLIICAINISNWFYFILGMFLFFVQAYIFYKNKDYKLISVLICSYIIAYSTAITSEYLAARPNFHFELFTAVFMLYNIYYKNEPSIIIKTILWIVLLGTMAIEIIIYSYIGNINQIRMKDIQKVKDGKTTVLETKVIKAPFNHFHIDPNSPCEKEYWAYEAFLDYYKLPSNITVTGKI